LKPCCWASAGAHASAVSSTKVPKWGKAGMGRMMGGGVGDERNSMESEGNVTVVGNPYGLFPRPNGVVSGAAARVVGNNRYSAPIEGRSGK
jgi:hypothetical protein